MDRVGTMWQQFAQLLTEWNGIPIWGMALVMLITLIKTYPIIQRNLLEARERRESRYSSRITELEAAVTACQKECEEHKQSLHSEISGLKAQHIMQQITLLRTIVDIFPDAPQLKLLLRALELGDRSKQAQELPGVRGDAHNER
jgi:hypothetical protein